MMEGDAELKLQKASSDLITDFKTLLARYLRKKRLVSYSTTKDLIKMLEPFQEWPQLLDPHLKQLVPPLVSVFLDYLTKYVNQYKDPSADTSTDAIPLPRGISRILYTFCKIRGYKVISQFFNNEPKYLEPMLYAYDMWNHAGNSHDGMGSKYENMTWEERYIMLLWISHLMLTPFDLAFISSNNSTELENLPIILSIEMPSIARRVTQIAIRTLGAASKEREAAGILLARVALRPDMRSYDLLNSTLEWALASFKGGSDVAGAKSIYANIGVLSFLAGVVSSADSKIIDPFLQVIFRNIQAIVSQDSANQIAIYSSALARKLIIKVFRAIAVHTLRSGLEKPSQTQLSGGDILEEVIDHLLNGLADKDTPVRYAASKALSIIAARLDPTLAADVVEALVGCLEENVLWEDLATGQTIANHDVQNLELKSFRRNLTAVNPLKWHGLVLALSQLLYRRSHPPEQLPNILNALILALSFEQRSAVGASVGTSVRDAACFGIWALARRYTTKELLAIDASLIRAASSQEQSVSILQILADEIVVAACLDSSGNIRRGASAALQELIGRHPDTIEQGISVVQVVDYHAVALRSRAMIEVSSGASDLDELYWHVLLDGLLGWRGVGSPDAPSRREAATAIGELSPKYPGESIRKIRESLKSTTSRQVEERHGLILSFAAIIAKLGLDKSITDRASISSLTSLPTTFEDIHLTDKDFTTSTLRPQLTAEAICRLMCTFGSASRSSSSIARIAGPMFKASLDRSIEFLQLSLQRTEYLVINEAMAAAREIVHSSAAKKREELIEFWISNISNGKSRTKSHGMIATLGAAFQQFKPSDEMSRRISDCLVSQLGPEIEIETKVWAVRSLESCISGDNRTTTTSIVEALARSLDDYTTDQRGDIGSLLRLEAIHTADQALQNDHSLDRHSQEILLSRICRLSVEKLDKIRNRAWECLKNSDVLFPSSDIPLHLSDTSSTTYFAHILTLTLNNPYLLLPILTGLLTSASSGTESLLRASRSALASHIDTLSNSQLHTFLDSFLTIIDENLKNERLLIPALDVLAFLGDINLFDRVAAAGIPFQSAKALTLLSKSHYKSTNVRKLLSCVSCYSSLSRIPSVQRAALTKLTSLLLHPYPKVRLSPLVQ